MDINSIYNEYFEIIDSFFGGIKHYLGDEENSHIDLGIKIANYPLISDLILDSIDDLYSEIEKFWGTKIQIVIDFIRGKDTLKCLYSGGVTPVNLENFVKKSALYIDTIILPDPILSLTLLQKDITFDKKYYLNKLIRHVFNIWKLKDLVLANTEEKIMLLLPINIQIVNTNDQKRLLEEANEKSTNYLNSVLNQNFKDSPSCSDYLNKLTSIDDLFNNIKNQDLLPNTFKTQDSLNKFMIDFSDTGRYSIFGNKSIGWNFWLYISSQFIRVQEHKFFCSKLVTEPIYDYELPWFFFNYDIGGIDMDASIANALQKEKFDWISNIPISVLKIFREENKLDYMRNIIRHGITDLKARNDYDLIKTSKQIENNFKEAFKRQKSELKLLEKRVKEITKKDIPITTGGFLAGYIPYLNNVISIIFAGRDIYKLVKERKIVKQEIDQKEQSIINLLMKSYERK